MKLLDRDRCCGMLIEMSEQLSELTADPDGMATYDYIVNNVDSCLDEMEPLVENLKRVDLTGQFLASSARFLAAVDRAKFEEWLAPLVEGAIEKDRERKYITSLLDAIWGKNYKDRAEELRLSDNLFRRLYKRVYPTGAM